MEGEEGREHSRRQDVEHSRADIDYEGLHRQSDKMLREEAALGPHVLFRNYEETIYGPNLTKYGSQPGENIPDYAWILVVVFGLCAAAIWIVFFLF